MSYCQGCGRADMAGITHVCPPLDGFVFTSEAVSPSDPIRLPDLIRKAFAYPRFLSIGAIGNVVEVRISQELYEEIKAIIGKPVGE